ncbi:peptide ligase PGM1-related protein [Actinomadura sp. KC06]|uniref:peptide ligase PGM1-related protein n=1 Tax=Actinomadura sp. KC06 TaxID=2530369 RepID=UPI001AA0008F|nr:peptide ligase PGM1-related protein [Actinomadura sp. KC06]
MILLYAFQYAERALAEVPYLRFSAERTLCFLDDLRDPRSRIVAVMSEPVDPYTLEYHFRDIFRFDDRMVESARERLTIVVPAAPEVRPLDELVHRDDQVMELLRNTVRADPAAVIVNFAASRRTDELARAIGSSAEESDHLFADRWGGKAGGKELLIRAGVAVPGGTPELAHGEAAVVSAVKQLTSGPIPPRRVLVKLSASTWAASIGNVLVDCDRLLRTRDLVGSAEMIRMPGDDFRRELAESGAIVEEFVDEAVSSPSAQGWIGDGGTVDTIACHEQLLVDGQYWGCRSAVDEQWRPAMVTAMERTGAALAELGHRGSFGVDFVTVPRRGLLAVEVNLRKVGPSHVVRYVEAIAGAKAGKDGLVRRPDGRRVHYSHRRLFEPDVLTALDPRSAVDRLRAEGLLYRHEAGEGVALHVLGGLDTCGFVELTALAPSAELADTHREAAEAALMRT